MRDFASVKQGRKVALTSRIMQLVHELCRKKIHVTKRDLFYTDVKLFKKQSESDEIIEDVAAMIGSTRSSLNGQPHTHCRTCHASVALCSCLFFMCCTSCSGGI